eukprot:s464_g10.t1
MWITSLTTCLKITISVKQMRFTEQMLERKRSGGFDGPDVGERAVLRMVWYQYCQNQRTIDKMQLLDLLKAINQPPANEHDDLDETFKEIDTKGDGATVPASIEPLTPGEQNAERPSWGRYLLYSVSCCTSAGRRDGYR